MAGKQVNKLVAKHLPKLPDGRHNDGDGLYLFVRGGSRLWVLRYRDRVTGKLRDKGLGAFPAVSLADARDEAASLRSGLNKGVDPIDAKRAAITAAKLERARTKTFGGCVTAYIAAHKAGWKNAKHAAQWRNTLDKYAASLLPLPVQAIDTTLVLDVLQPIWIEKAETATRVRQRIEAVLDWAKVRKYRDGENPARLRGHLDLLLPKNPKKKRVKHHAALAYEGIHDLWVRLSEVDTLAGKALRFIILTATRQKEATGASWEEIDLAKRLWVIPGERMKAGREHRVPLSDAAVKLLEAIPGDRKGWVFPGSGRKPGPLSIAATLQALQALEPDLTVHGFRSTFRDWAGDMSAHPREVVETALAHVIADQTEAAYRRRDALERRARLMQEWANFCQTEPRKQGQNIVAMKRSRK